MDSNTSNSKQFFIFKSWFPLAAHHANRFNMLHVHELTYRIGGRVLFDQASIAIPAGKKVGLVGRNGTGKTTLFKIIKEEISADSGSINISKLARVGTVEQEGNINEQQVHPK